MAAPPRRIRTRIAACAVFMAGAAAMTMPVAVNAFETDGSVKPDAGDGFSVIVIGDAPYSKADEKMLAEALPLVRAGAYPFVIHLGDYKGGRTPCTSDHDDRFAALIAELAPTPVMYTPGDNEWTDCDRNKNPDTGVRYSDLDRLEIVRARFASTDPETPASWPYRRQETLPENARWRYRGVQFLTLHVTGTNNARDWVTGDAPARAAAAVAARDAANLDWLRAGFAAARKADATALVIAMHGDPTDVEKKPEDRMCTDVALSGDHPCDAFTDLRAAIRDEATAFGLPVLVAHGDTAPFTLDQEFAGEEAPNLWRLNAAGDAGIGRTGLPYGVRDITRLYIDPRGETPFAAEGVVTGKRPR